MRGNMKKLSLVFLIFGIVSVVFGQEENGEESEDRKENDDGGYNSELDTAAQSYGGSGSSPSSGYEGSSSGYPSTGTGSGYSEGRGLRGGVTGVTFGDDYRNSPHQSQQYSQEPYGYQARPAAAHSPGYSGYSGAYQGAGAGGLGGGLGGGAHAPISGQNYGGYSPVGVGGLGGAGYNQIGGIGGVGRLGGGGGGYNAGGLGPYGGIGGPGAGAGYYPESAGYNGNLQGPFPAQGGLVGAGIVGNGLGATGGAYRSLGGYGGSPYAGNNIGYQGGDLGYGRQNSHLGHRGLNGASQYNNGYNSY